MSDRWLTVGSWKKLSLQVRLWLWVGLSGYVAPVLFVLPVGAQEVGGVDEWMSGGVDEFELIPLPHPPIDPSTPSSLSDLSDLEQSATTIDEWVAQIEASLVQITNVRVEATEAGLQVILETAEGSLEVPETRSIGNALIADIANATIAEEFSQAEPIEGIALVSVTNLPGDRVRVAITGTDAPPVAEVTSEAQGLVLAVVLGDADAVAEEDAIQVVVTGEQDEGYNPANTSVGTRTDTLLRDIPQSIQIVPQEVLRDRNVTQINEALENVPGVLPVFGGSRLNTSDFVIRGFETNAADGNNFLRNGLRESGATPVDLAPNIERIEVLLGPASVLYGLANPGGTINLVTKQPLREPFYAVDATIGSYEFYRGAIDLSGPLNDSRTILYRLNAAYLDRGSFVDFFNANQFSIAPVISFSFGERTRLILEGEYTDRSTFVDPGLPAIGTVLPNPNGDISRDRNVGEPDTVFDSRIGRLGYRLEHQFSDNWSIQQAFQWRAANFNSDDSFYVFPASLDADNRTLDRVTQRLIGTDTNVYDFNVNLIGNFSTGSIDHQLVFGVDWVSLPEL
jgi:iron complex outermembrane recepter protein